MTAHRLEDTMYDPDCYKNEPSHISPLKEWIWCGVVIVLLCLFVWFFSKSIFRVVGAEEVTWNFSGVMCEKYDDAKEIANAKTGELWRKTIDAKVTQGRCSFEKNRPVTHPDIVYIALIGSYQVAVVTVIVGNDTKYVLAKEEVFSVFSSI